MTVRNAIIGPFLTLFWIASLTPTANAQVDSTREIPVPKYVLWRMFHDIETGRVCDSLVNYQHGVIQRAVFVIKKQDSLLTWRYDQIGNLQQEAKWWEERYANQVQATKAEKKETKRWKFATILGGGLIILIALL
jgi:hypothetical protein